MVKQSEEKWLSADDVAKQVGVSSMTIKRNCNMYEEFILFKQGEKNKYYVFGECVEVLKFINRLRNKKNLPHKEILEILNREGFKKYIVVDEMGIVQNEISKQTTEQSLFTADDVRRIVSEEVTKIVQEQLSKKDDQILYLIQEVQDLKKALLEEKQVKLEMSSSKQIISDEEKKESWWKRLWGNR